MPIGPFHAGTVNRLNRFLGRLSQGRWLVAVQNPIRLSEHSEAHERTVRLCEWARRYHRHG